MSNRLCGKMVRQLIILHTKIMAATTARVQVMQPLPSLLVLEHLKKRRFGSNQTMTAAGQKPTCPFSALDLSVVMTRSALHVSPAAPHGNVWSWLIGAASVS